MRQPVPDRQDRLVELTSDDEGPRPGTLAVARRRIWALFLYRPSLLFRTVQRGVNSSAQEVMVVRVVIVYESMYGNTHLVAEKMAEGVNSRAEAVIVPVAKASHELVEGADLLVVGGPTHMHGLSSSMSRHAAESDAEKQRRVIDPDAEGEGLRTWFHGLDRTSGTPSAAFDTRLDGPTEFTGRAAKGIVHRLEHHGFRVIAAPESFIVDKENHLLPGEGDRARAWAIDLVEKLSPVA